MARISFFRNTIRCRLSSSIGRFVAIIWILSGRATTTSIVVVAVVYSVIQIVHLLISLLLIMKAIPSQLLHEHLARHAVSRIAAKGGLERVTGIVRLSQHGIGRRQADVSLGPGRIEGDAPLRILHGGAGIPQLQLTSHNVAQQQLLVDRPRLKEV